MNINKSSYIDVKIVAHYLAAGVEAAAVWRGDLDAVHVARVLVVGPAGGEVLGVRHHHGELRATEALEANILVM